MFDITKLALKIPNFLTNQECDSLVNEFNNSNDYWTEQSINNKTNKLENSNYKVVLVKPKSNNFNLVKQKTKKAIDIYLKYLDQPKYFSTELLKKCLLYSHYYRIMKYETGSEIHPHIDYNLCTYGSITFNLNENYEGGEFKFFNGNYTVSLKKGDVLIFPASHFWIHEVTKVTKGTRYSLNSFLLRYPQEVIDKLKNYSNTETSNYIKRTPADKILGPYN